MHMHHLLFPVTLRRCLVHELITVQSVTWSFRLFQPYKSPGPDGVLPVMLHHVNNETIKWISSIYRQCLLTNCMPSSWRNVRVTFIPKPGKSNYQLPRAYRPMSLASFLLKGLERIVDNYIRTDVLKQYPISPNQHAFISDRSTDTALHSLKSQIQKAKDRGNYLLCAFLDIEGAFDRTNTCSVQKALTQFHVDESISAWICNVLSKRVVFSSLNDFSSVRNVSGGCPQGGVLSPPLWTLVTDGLLNQLIKSGFRCIGYADDIVIIIEGKVLPTLSDLMQHAFSLVERWCRSNELAINPTKVDLALFTNRRKYDMRLPHLSGYPVQLSHG